MYREQQEVSLGERIAKGSELTLTRVSLLPHLLRAPDSLSLLRRAGLQLYGTPEREDIRGLTSAVTTCRQSLPARGVQRAKVV